MMLRRLIFLCLWFSAGVGAAEMRVVEVEYDDGYYTMMSEVWFDVAREPLFDVFSDWDVSVEFSSFVVEAKNVGPDEHGAMGYYSLNRGCILFFCKTVERNGSVTTEAFEVIHALADPASSDFELSDETWTFFDDADGTVVRYELTMKPAFWVPPVIGPYLIKRKLQDDGSDAIERIESIAQERAQERAQESVPEKAQESTAGE